MMSFIHLPWPCASVSAEKQLMPDTGSVTNRNSHHDTLQTGSALHNSNGQAANQRATIEWPTEAALKLGLRHVAEGPLGQAQQLARRSRSSSCSDRLILAWVNACEARNQVVSHSLMLLKGSAGDEAAVELHSIHRHGPHLCLAMPLSQAGC
jgi:hypothetical protein